MEKAIPSDSSTKQTHDTHTRNIPVQKNVDFIMEHLNDPNFDLVHPPSFSEEHQTRSHVRQGGNVENNFENESPYPEVQATVSSVDDPLMPVNTFRMWFLGILFTLFTSGLNQVFKLRFPSIVISGIFVQLVCLPFGQALAAILPTKRFNTLGYIWSLNPGPFSIKEHVCITIMVDVGAAAAYHAATFTLTQRVFYGQTTPLIFRLLLAIGPTILGFSFVGFLRQFIIWPSSMIWPYILAYCALFNTLHKKYRRYDQGHMTREYFFCIAMAGSFIWYWVPSYLVTALSMFNWVCWIAPNNVIINTLFGTNTGLGMGVLTFDWGLIASLGIPLFTPWWSQMNIGVGFFLVFWFLAPILYFTNVWNSAHFPISGRIAFDNIGSPYNVQNIITNGVFDPVKYAAYSPVFIPTTVALATGAAFAAFPAFLVHTLMWYRKDIVQRFHNTLKDEHDVHSSLMQYYPQVPMWWYVITGVISFTFICTTIEIFSTHLPIWAAIIGILIAFSLAIPVMMLQAISNQPAPTPVMYELIAGYMLPGRPIANAMFKTIVHTITSQTCDFAGTMKLGHYMKVPPHTLFFIQIVASIFSCIWVTIIQDWMLNNIKDICTPHQKQSFICPGSTVFATSSVIFGAVGPQRLFSPGAPYSALLWFFPIGIIAPIAFYLLAHHFPLGTWRYINVPVFFNSLTAIPHVSGIAYSSSILCAFIFNYVIRRFHFRWWMQYNHVLAVAINSGTALSLIMIFFTLTIPKRGSIVLNWWGNTVWKNTADARGTPFEPIPESGFIGPTKWS